jgi:motility quorum-sensing regulator/GCU-specific mRNA interferase toxin
MEKKVAHYPLAVIHAQVQQLGALAFTATAIQGGASMGLTVSDMMAVVVSLTRRQLYKSMTTYADHTLWQDVYHAELTVSGVTKTAYIKITGGARAPVIQFKEK